MAEKEMTDEEIREGFECLRWFQKNGPKMIEAILNPTWPKKEGL